jgi:hypothetical protein
MLPARSAWSTSCQIAAAAVPIPDVSSRENPRSGV